MWVRPDQTKLLSTSHQQHTDLHVAEVVQLHGRGEVQQHVRQVGTLAGQLVQHGVGRQLDRQLDVAQRGAEASTVEKPERRSGGQKRALSNHEKQSFVGKEVGMGKE